MNILFYLQVHDILGIGDYNIKFDIDMCDEGVMENVKASPNDPVFFLHHTTVDCILEAWLFEHQNNLMYPTSDPNESNKIPEGHGANDYIVPFIPLHTHKDMFKTADNFGYDCDLFKTSTVTVPTEESPTTVTDKENSSISLLFSYSLLFVVLTTAINNII